MQVATGTVANGRIVLEGVFLTEGEVVTVVTRGADESFVLTEAQENEFLAAMAEIERGEYGTLEELPQSAEIRLSMPLRIKISAKAASQVRKAAEWWA